MSVGESTRDDPPAPDPRRWLALVILLVAGFMDLLDVTIVNVAIPTVMRDLGAEYSQIEWIVSGYVLGFAALLITGGRLGDIYGRKRLFLVGVAGFTVASTLCGAVSSPEMLIAGRFFQGAMAGLMVPQILAIIHVTFPRHERGKVLGLWGAVLGTASVAGLVVGGGLVELDLFGLGWRPIFLVNAPVGVVASIAAYFVVRESRSPAAPQPVHRAGRPGADSWRRPLDLIGVALAVPSVLMVIYPLTEGRSLGWPVWTFLLLAGAVVLLLGFVAYERRRAATVGSPLVVLRLFRSRAFTAGMVGWLIFWVAFGGFFLLWTLYMQVGLGWSALHAGLTASSFAVGAALGSWLSIDVLTPRFGRRVLMAGALLGAAGFGSYLWVVSADGPDIESWRMVAPLVVLGLGFGVVVAPMVDAILTSVPTRDAGSGSGLLSTIQQVGMALGIALAGVFFFTQLENDAGQGVDAVAPELREEFDDVGVPGFEQDRIIAGLRVCVMERAAEDDPTEVPASCLPAEETGPSAEQAGPADSADERVRTLLADAGERANAENYARTFSHALWLGAGLMGVVFLGLFALPRQVRAHDLDAEPVS